MQQPGLRGNHYFAGVLIAIIFGAISILSGCATTAHQEPQYVSQPDDIDVVPTQTFNLADLLTDNKRPAIDVQLTKPGEVAEVFPENALEGASAGLFAWVFVGLPGMLLDSNTYSASLTDIAIVAAAGAIIFTTGGAVWGEINRNDHAIVSKVFQETDFSAHIQYILDKNLSLHFPGQPDGITAIQLLILSYGFRTKGVDTLEFHCEADIQVKHAGEPVFQDFIFWSAQKRSQDVPPPVSASLGAFARDEGALMKSMLHESSAVVAAVVLKRLKVSHETDLYDYNMPADQRLSGVQQQFSGSANQREGLADEL